MVSHFSSTEPGTPACLICGGDALLELIRPEGILLCARCGGMFRRICNRLHVDPNQVFLSTSTIKDLGADSLDLIELAMELEEDYGIQLPKGEIEPTKTIGELIAAFVTVRHRGQRR